MTETPPPAPGAANWALILALGVVWGTAFLGMSVALEGFGPLWVAAGRCSIGALALLAIGTVTGRGLAAMPDRRAWTWAGALGVFNVALPFTLLAWGLQHVTSGFAGITMGAVPLMLLPLVYVFSPEEGIGPRRILGVILGFVGLAILVGPGAAATTGSPSEPTARFACLAAAACYACGSILTRRAPAMPPLGFATAMLIGASGILVPLALVVEGLPEIAPSRAALALVYVGILPTGLAFLMRIRIITTAGSLFMSLVGYMVPVWAVLFGAILLREPVPPSLLTALALILAGIALTQWRSFMALRRR